MMVIRRVMIHGSSGFLEIIDEWERKKMEEDFKIPKWEYKEIDISGEEFFKEIGTHIKGTYDKFSYEENPNHYLPQLQELGKKGWEVCGCFSFGNGRVAKILLKRQSGYLRCERK